MAEKISNFFNSKNTDEEEDDELKLNQGYHVDDMLGYPSLIDKIRQRIEEDDQITRPRRQTNQETFQSIRHSTLNRQEQGYEQYNTRNQQSFMSRKKVNSHDQKAEKKGGVISKYKHLETKFLLDFMIKDDLHDLYQAVNLQKKTEMLMILLKRSLGQLEIFRTVEQNLNSDLYGSLIRSLKTLIVKQGSTIFSFGSVGKQYYFLIKGSVYILLRTGLGSKINSLEQVNNNKIQHNEKEHLSSEKKRQIRILRKRDSFEGGGQSQQSVITTTQKKTKFLTYASKLQSSDSKVLQDNLDNISEKDSPSNKQLKFSWDQPVQKQQSQFQNNPTSSTNIADQQQDLKYLLQLQANDKLNDDSRSQKSIEDKLSIAWSQDSQRNKEEIKKKFPHFQIVGTHQQGDGFGELSLLKGIKRTATIVAKEDCFFLTLDKDNYLKFLSEYHEKIYQEKINFVKQFFIFEQLDKRLPSLIILFEPKSYISGQCIYEPGDEVSYLYLIKKGTVAISRKIVQKSEKQLLKQVEYENSISSKYEREIQQEKSFMQQQQKQQKQQGNRNSQSLKDSESEITSKQEYIYENRKVENAVDKEWDRQQESEQSQGEEENIQDLIYSEEKGTFVGKNNKIFSMMRNSPVKNRQSKLNSKSVSPKKNTTLTVAGELCFFGEEEIVNGEKFRQYEARVTSSKVDILRISIKNLKIITKYNDVMQRIRAYHQLKNEWRHAYVERSQNALLIQEYLAKNFKEQYTQNILNKDIQQKAAIQLTAKTIPHSMNPQKINQSVITRKLYIKSNAKQFKHKRSMNSEVDDQESQKLLQKQSSNDLNNASSRKIHFKNSDTISDEEDSKIRNRNFSSPKKVLVSNATLDISSRDFEQKVSFSFQNNKDEIENVQKQKVENAQKQKAQIEHQKSLEQNYQKQNSMLNSIKKSQFSSPQQVNRKDSLMESNKKVLSSQKENLNDSHKFIKIQKADSIVETLNTNNNEQSVEDLLTFQTQQKQLKRKQTSKIQSDEIQIHEFLDYVQSDDNESKKTEEQNINSFKKQQFRQSSQDFKFYQSTEKMQRQPSKPNAETRQIDEQKVQQEIEQFQKQQENEMEKLRGILMKERKKSTEKKTNQIEKKLNNSQESDFREIHNIFISIEGIKSKKLNKYTKQYKEVKEKFSKEPKKKIQYLPQYGSEKAKEIVSQSKEKKNTSAFISEKKAIINDTSIISRQRSNSISVGPSQQNRKFSFRQYLENQKTVSVVQSISNNQMKTAMTPDYVKTNQSVVEINQSQHLRKHSYALYDDNKLENKQIVVQLSDKSHLRNQIGYQNSQNYQNDDINVEILDKTQNYYFQKTPNRPQSHKQAKELDRIIEKDNSMILYQDQQDHRSENMIEESKKIEESDIDQVRNMLLLVKKLKIDHLMENKYTDQNFSSGVMSKSINIVSLPTTARSASQKQRRKISVTSDKKDYNQNYDTGGSYGKAAVQEVSQFNSTCINFKDESINQNNSFSKKIYNLTEREQQKRKQSSGAIFRPTVPLQQFPLKSVKPSEKQSFSIHSRYQSFHHVRNTNL